MVSKKIYICPACFDKFVYCLVDKNDANSSGVTTVLSMTTMGFGGRSQLPKVSYRTALDWFVILCFSFVFAVMVEYAAINFIDTLTTELKKLIEDRRKAAAAAAQAQREKVENFSVPTLTSSWFLD
jgi:hypothetical protein